MHEVIERTDESWVVDENYEVVCKCQGPYRSELAEFVADVMDRDLLQSGHRLAPVKERASEKSSKQEGPSLNLQDCINIFIWVALVFVLVALAPDCVGYCPIASGMDEGEYDGLDNRPK